MSCTDSKALALAGALFVSGGGDVLGAIAGPPVLSLDAAQYCSGSQWRLAIVNGAPLTSIRLAIRSEGYPETAETLGQTDASGSFYTTGTAVRWAEGRYVAQVEIGDSASNVVHYEAPRCTAIDLSGRYLAPSSVVSIRGAVASATTNSRGDRRGEGQVYEINQGRRVPEFTHTPFADDVKRPRALDGLDLRGTRVRCDVDLHDVTTWIVDSEFFQIGAGRQADPDDTGTEEFFVFIYRSGLDQFALYMETDWDQYRESTTYYAAPSETRFRIYVDIDVAGTEALLQVVPLDGPRVGTVHPVAPLRLDLRHDNFTSASFFAGFTQNLLQANSDARVNVDNCIVDGWS